MHRIDHCRTLLIVLVLVLALAWAAVMPAPTPAAPAEGITPLLLGSLTGSTTTTPGPADALFTTLAAAATTSIDVALYDFDRATVRDALLTAHARGVTVRVVGDDEVAATSDDGPFYDSLTAAGIPVVLDNRASLQHNKFAVFDGQITWTGSANFSDTAFTRNGENVLVITATTVAQLYSAEFAEMIAGAFGTAKTPNTSQADQTVAGADVTIAFAPTDGLEAKIIDAIVGASKHIQVAMFTFTSTPIATALTAAHQRGVVVEVLLDSRSASLGQRDALCTAGITVRVEDWAGTLHDKYAVIDAGTDSDPTVVTGSANWTQSAVQANDENLLVIRDAMLAQVFAADHARLKAAIGADAFACNVGAPVTPTPAAFLPIIMRISDSSTIPTPTATSGPTSVPTATSTTPTGVPTATPTRTTIPTATTGTACDPSYPDVCIPSPPPDLNCSDISYRRFRVLPPDPHHFDTDNDGIGCESG